MPQHLAPQSEPEVSSPPRQRISGMISSLSQRTCLHEGNLAPSTSTQLNCMMANAMDAPLRHAAVTVRLSTLGQSSVRGPCSTANYVLQFMGQSASWDWHEWRPLP